MAWLVTGGAGYIGAHVVRAFVEEGIEAVVLDDLSSGHRHFVSGSVPSTRAASWTGRYSKASSVVTRSLASFIWRPSSTPEFR